MKPSREIALLESSSAMDGGCNACTFRPCDSPGIPVSYRVWVLSLRSVSVRLCDGCLCELGWKTAMVVNNERLTKETL